MRNTLVKAIAFMTVILATYVAKAAEYQINISGEYTKPFLVFNTFGITDSNPVPISLSFVIDTNLGAPQVIAAGAVVNPADPVMSQYTFATAVTVIPKSAIKNLGVSLGNSNWLTEHVTEQMLGSKIYGAVVSGTLTNGNVTKLSLLLTNGAGLFSTNNIECDGSNICTFANYGYAFDYIANDSGGIENMTATITELTGLSTEQKLTSLDQSVTASDATKASRIVLASHIKVAQKAVSKGNTNQLIQALESFIKMTEVQSGKSISLEDAAELGAKAQATLDSLT